MKVKLISYPVEPEKLMASAAKLCYSDSDIDNLMDGLDDEDISRRIDDISESGHTSVLEHAQFTFLVEDVSRSLLAQLTRHRIASYSVQSQRYVSMDNFKFITPDAIKRIPAAVEKIQ